MWRSSAGEEDRTPCCMVTEGEWTWFGSTLLITFLVAVFNLKYYRKVVGRPHNLLKVKKNVFKIILSLLTSDYLVVDVIGNLLKLSLRKEEDVKVTHLQIW